MKLLVDAHCFDSARHEGTNTYLKGIYNQVPELAPDLEIVFAGADLDRLRENFPSLPNTSFVQTPVQKRLGRILKVFPALIDKLHPDFAHFQYIAPPGISCRKIVTLHDLLFMDYPDLFPFFYRNIRSVAFRRSAKSADILLTVSQYSKERIAARFGIDPDCIGVTPNAPAPEFFHPDREKALETARKNGVRPYLLTVARVEPRKNHAAIIRAFRDMKLAEKGYDLVMAGPVSIPVPELAAELASLDGETRKRVHQIVPRSQEELRLWYAGARLFLFPSLAEGFGIPPLEAAASQIPVICNNATALADFTLFGDYLIDFSDSGLLEKNIHRELFGNPMTADRLKQISSEVARLYSWGQSASAFLSCIFGQ